MPNHVHLIAVPRDEQSLSRALAGAHSEYALAFNRAERRSGHAWQNRFYSCPMDGPHLVRALCQVELNPVRARLAATAWEWPWSSARAHALESAMDAVLDCRWPDHLKSWDYLEWKEILGGAGMVECEKEAIRRATLRGEPLGSRRFLVELERAGRRLRVLEPGRPERRPDPRADGEQGSLFE